MRRKLQGAGNEMDDILARAACDSRMTPVIEDIAKAVENENRDCAVSQAHVGGCRSSCSRSPETSAAG
jgi:hypothetical protein